MQKYNTVSISINNLSDYCKIEHVLPCPTKLYIKSAENDISKIFSGPKVAIVGARKVTDYGVALTKKLGYDLAKSGVTIISGLALGVDSIGHQAALEAGGRTIAVLPSDLEHIYPRSHHSLARRILESRSENALVSEYTDNSTPMKHHFLERNRIIAGLADAVLITEAAVRSGSLSTARHALELGIPVMAVPGRVDNPMSQGTNNLIKAGAHLVSNVSDIFAILDIDRKIELPIDKYQPENDLESLVIEQIKSGVNNANSIIENSGVSANLIQQTLTMLEIKGVVRSNDYFNWYLV